MSDGHKRRSTPPPMRWQRREDGGREDDTSTMMHRVHDLFLSNYKYVVNVVATLKCTRAWVAAKL